MEKIEEIIVSYFKKEVQEIMEPWFESGKRQRSKLEKQVFRFGFLEFGQKAEKYGVHFP